MPVKDERIPTNVITGFLGAGKTTLILDLLARKPGGETWAVLVNEFGEVGIDGALLGSTAGVRMREVPGGCICCSAQLPLQVGLNALLRGRRPQRLLVEPTGLGHPEEILRLLAGEWYRDVLEPRATLTLVDPRRISDPRSAEHSLFQRQVAVADAVVASKLDLCTEADLSRLREYIAARGRPGVPLLLADRRSGESLEEGADASSGQWLQWLDRERGPLVAAQRRAAVGSDWPAADMEAAAAGEMRRASRSADGYVSYGWVFEPGITFSYDDLFLLFSAAPARRLKAVMITDRGVCAFNAEEGVLRVQELDECADSRVEYIHHEALDWQALEQRLRKAAGLAPGF